VSVWGTVKNFIMKLLRIQPAIDHRVITIQEPFSYEANVLKNRIWYPGRAVGVGPVFQADGD